MMTSADASSGAMLAEGVAILRRNWPLLLLAGACDALLEYAQQIEDRERLAGLAGVILVAVGVTLTQIAVQGVVGRNVLVRERMVDPSTPARFGAYMGVSVLVLLGIAFGFALLIVPGILLALRWALAANFTLTREMGLREALEASRDASNGHRGEIFGAYVVFGLAVYAPLLVLIPIAGGFDAFNSTDPGTVLGAMRVAWSTFMEMAGLALGIGLFSILVGRDGHLSEVFA
jgi:hypothetical protein